MTVRRALLAAVAVLAVAGTAGGAATASATAGHGAQDAPPGVADVVVASVGKVRSAGGSGSGWAAGDGSVVTNFHVAKGGSGDIYLDWSDGVRVECWTATANRDRDLAVLRCPTDDRRVLPVDPELPAAGDPVVVVGYPLGVGPTVTTGVATGERREARGILTFGFTAPIEPGSSGSPVVDAAGRVRGVATFGGGYAVPAEELVPMLERASSLPVTKSDAEWRIRLRRAVLAALVAGLVGLVLRRRSGAGSPLGAALRWAAVAVVAVLVLTQVQFAMSGPTSFL